MDLATVLSQINTKAGFRRDVAKAQEALTLALEHLENEKFLPWFLLSEYETALTCTAESRIPLPDHYIKGFEEGELYYIDDAGIMRELIKVELDEAQHHYAEAVPSYPQHYALAGKYFRLFPAPDKQYRLKMMYYRKSRKEWADPENVNIWLQEAARLVISCAAIILMEDTRDMTGLQIQGTVRDIEWQNLYYRHVERAEINHSRDRGLN